MARAACCGRAAPSRSRQRGKDRRLQAALDRALLEPGEAAELRARAVDDAGRPAGVPRVTLERLDEAGQPVAGTRQQPAFSAVADTDLASVRLAGLEPKMSERRTTTSLWQNHGALVAVLALLVVEWMWRKRRGLS